MNSVQIQYKFGRKFFLMHLLKPIYCLFSAKPLLNIISKWSHLWELASPSCTSLREWQWVRIRRCGHWVWKESGHGWSEGWARRSFWRPHGWWGPGLVTNSILFYWLFKIKDRCKKVRFQQTHNQGLRQLLLTVSWDLRAYRGTPGGVLVSL